jgi:hypothetical protein
MKKRQTFQCWNCSRTYTLFKDFNPKDKISIACPYCHAEAVVDLEPYSVVMIHKGEKSSEENQEHEIKLPEIIITHKPI